MVSILCYRLSSDLLLWAGRISIALVTPKSHSTGFMAQFHPCLRSERLGAQSGCWIKMIWVECRGHFGEREIPGFSQWNLGNILRMKSYRYSNRNESGISRIETRNHFSQLNAEFQTTSLETNNSRVKPRQLCRQHLTYNNNAVLSDDEYPSPNLGYNSDLCLQLYNVCYCSGLGGFKDA